MAKKQKYPATRELKSNAAIGNKVLFNHYTTRPSTVITINADIPEVAKKDLVAAVDDILAFHGL